uniref:Pleckstrin homology domain containing, family A member 7a n=1 Tax=Gasterosteus aculeatus aculeatus TaxID=481459 RepID=A0AAQ4R9S8_GASAC
IMAAPLGRDALPEHWSYGVRADGRVFFINDEARNTTWLHPRSAEPVNSGHMIRSDLPQGWEEGFTNEGASYFINHNQRTTAFRHPVSGQISAENMDFILQEAQGASMMSKPVGEQLSSTTISEASTAITSSTGSRSSGKVHNFGKREQAIKRNPNVPVVVRGWLYKQDSSGMRLWKRKWFVLADFCLFYYKDSREESVLGSIPLPSYVISPVRPEDHISRKYAFKASHTGMRSYIYKRSSVIGSQAEHTGMRTYYFSADTQEDMSTWLRAMNQATLMQNNSNTPVRYHTRQAVPQMNHGNHHKTPGPNATRPGVHEVLLEPRHHATGERCSFHKDAAAMEHATTASTLPSGVCTRNGLVSTPSPILEPNGIAAGTYQRGPAATPPSDTPKQGHRRNTLEQVEQWVKVQKADPPSRENTLPRRTPPTQHKFPSIDACQTLPKTPRQSPAPGRLGEYKYAQDRLSHFRLAPDPGPNTVWQLYEWQQRHQYRHGSPTAPLYTPAPDYPFGPRPPSTVPPSSSAPRSEGPPRCVSVPPSSADLPPPGPPPGSSRTLSPTRRPHTPAGRVTVKPGGNRSAVDVPFALSPRRAKSQLLKAATIERRSLPPSGYITHTVSAPSLHGKTSDDTYMQLKKDLEYLDLKVREPQLLPLPPPLQVKLSRLCEQDKILQDLEARISSLKEDKDKLEGVLDVSHHQMEQYQEQPAHAHKIAYQQRLLQEDLVSIRAQMSRLSTEMAQAWEEFGRLERSVEQLRTALQAHMNHSQEKAEMKRELWRIEDVMGGLSASKANYKITIDSVQNPERKLVPSGSDPAVPSLSTEVQPPPRSSAPRILAHTLPHSTVPKWVSVLLPHSRDLLPNRAEDDAAPPRPPLPRLCDYEETPPAVPPLPREASVIRHTSVRGLKRQSDERKRDRESGQHVANGDCKADLRSYLSEPELPGLSQQNAASDEYQYFQSKGPSGCPLRPNQSDSIASYVTLRRGPGSAAPRRPKSALERLSSPTEAQQPPSGQPRGRMTAEEQLERMKRHQRSLVRERKRNLSQGERSAVGLSASGVGPRRSSSSSRLPSGTGQSDEGWSQAKERGRIQSDGWVVATAVPIREVDVEPLDYDLDISRELSKPQKVPIPERYVESDPEEPLSPEEVEERSRRAQRMKNLLAKSSFRSVRPSAPLDFGELDSALQQQERIMTASHALAAEASRKSKLVAGQCTSTTTMHHTTLTWRSVAFRRRV